jgi:hypothetical protein
MLLPPGGQGLWQHVSPVHLDECETPAHGIRRLYDYIFLTCQSGTSGRKMADYLSDALSMQSGKPPGTLGPETGIGKVPGLLMAALSYSGTWSMARYGENENRLKELIRQKDLKIVGEPVFARYNVFFMPWFLRRNEGLTPVSR